MALPYGAKVWVEVSESALRENVKALKATLDPGVEFCAVVKANAYGHGLAEVTKILLADGVSLFAVDSFEEAKIVRGLSTSVTIFIMGATAPELLVEVIKIDAIQTVFDPTGIRDLKTASKAAKRKALMTLEIETGLHRLGAGGRVLKEILALLKDAKEEIDLVSVASHLSSAEDASRSDITKAQYERFYLTLEEIRNGGFNPQHIHIGCSAAGIMHEFPHGSMVRFGIVMYGLWPSADVRRAGTLGKRHADIKPVLSFKTRVAQVTDVAPGGGIGYGPALIVNRHTRVATLPMGYYDSLDRRFSGNGSVIINGTRCNILGRVCMNMCMVDVSTVPGQLTHDTEVTVIGRGGIHAVTADDWAEKLGTINYEVVTRINPLLPRVVV